MTATCREPCCAAPRMTVSELFERGLRRNRDAPLPIRGDCRTDAEGNRASFSCDVADAKIVAIGFQVSPCATLIAYCELIAQTLPGRTVDLAQALTPRDLAEQLPGVPALKRGRAVLAIAAFRAALALAANSSSSHSGESHEGRLHLRHLAP
jgi:NifU-like protein involved in Fe-S cluster formation